jgi:PBP1b-binding outer membrane lipoprotein LpoB
MTKTALLLVILALPLMITGCGNSDSQQESVPAKPGSADDTPKLCSSIEGTGLAKQCSVNSRDSTVDVIIDSYDDQVARNICADVANKMTQLTANFSGSWKLQIFSPYRSDKPMAACVLH